MFECIRPPLLKTFSFLFDFLHFFPTFEILLTYNICAYVHILTYNMYNVMIRYMYILQSDYHNKLS